ncbi:MAG TPA: hypothetical protein PLA88_01005 [Bacteroidales bacterium]|nr:hypothetical protein [Bacteroidales bacterium]
MRKVLFITYYWPPAGGTLVNRMLKFYQYLPEYGWDPVVLTVENGFHTFSDESLIDIVRPQTMVYRSKGFRFFGLLKIFLPKSGNTTIPYGFTDSSKKSLKNKLQRWGKYNMIPDTKYSWKFGTVRQAVKIIRKEKIDLIFSTSPPQTNHIIARKAARKTGIPWVADFRDPWTDAYWINDPETLRWRVIHAIDKRIEGKTINAMSAMTTTGPSMVEIMQNKTKVPVTEITNGFDDACFEGLHYTANEKFRITFAGSLSQQHSPKCFFDAITTLCSNSDFASRFEIVFMGNFPNFLKELIAQYDFKDAVKLIPYQPFQQALEFISLSELLMVMIPNTPDNKVYIPLKVYDYMGSGRPILAYGPLEGDTASILERTATGKIFDYAQIEESAKYIQSIFEKWKNGEQTTSDKEVVNTYTRRNLTGKLARLFDQVSS